MDLSDREKTKIEFKQKIQNKMNFSPSEIMIIQF